MTLYGRLCIYLDCEILGILQKMHQVACQPSRGRGTRIGGWGALNEDCIFDWLHREILQRRTKNKRRNFWTWRLCRRRCLGLYVLTGTALERKCLCGFQIEVRNNRTAPLPLNLQKKKHKITGSKNKGRRKTRRFRKYKSVAHKSGSRQKREGNNRFGYGK